MKRIKLLVQVVMACLLVFVSTSSASAALSPTGLVGYYPFDGNGNDLGSNNVPVNIVDTSSAPSSFNGTGKFAQAFETETNGGNFPSPGGLSDVARDLSNSALPKLIGDDSYTLTGWFKFDAIGGQDQTQNTHFFDTDRTDPAGYRVSMIAGLDAGGGPQQQSLNFLSNGGVATIDLNSGGNPAWAADTWYFFAARLSGAGMTLWLAPESGTWNDRMGAVGAGGAPGAASAALQIGRDSGNGAMDGLKDDFSIWNRALTVDEVGEIFDAGVEGIPLGDILIPIPEPSTALLMFLGTTALLRGPARQRRVR